MVALNFGMYVFENIFNKCAMCVEYAECKIRIWASGGGRK